MSEVKEITEEPRHCVYCTEIYFVKLPSKRMYCDACILKRTGKGRPRGQ